MHMFIGLILKKNTSFIVIEVLKTILRAQVYFENYILMDYTRNNLYIWRHVINFYKLFLKGNSNFDILKVLSLSQGPSWTSRVASCL